MSEHQSQYAHLPSGSDAPLRAEPRRAQRPGDPAARRPGLPRPGRRAALPARRRRHRRPPRHPAARRPRHRRRSSCRPRSGCASSWPTAPPPRSPARSAPATCARALAQGVDGLWLAVVHRRRGHGRPGVAAGRAARRPVRRRAGTSTGHATTYLRIAFLGTTPLLVMLAATGVLRGLQDTRTPLVVAVVGNVLNVVLNVAARLRPRPRASPAPRSAPSWPRSAPRPRCSSVVVRGRPPRRARRCARTCPGIRAAAHAARRPGDPHAHAARRAAGHDVRRGGSAAPAGATGVDLATHQLALTIWTFLAFALDAIAIAAQAITGRYLGAGDVAGTRAVTRRMVRWGVVSGVVTGLVLAALSARVLGSAVHRRPRGAGTCWSRCCWSPRSGSRSPGVVFVLDGVLIGAGDGAYLAWAGLVVLAVYAPVRAAGRRAAPARVAAAECWAPLTWIWVAFTVVFMGARAVVLAAPRARRRLAGHRCRSLTGRGHLSRTGIRTVRPRCADQALRPAGGTAGQGRRRDGAPWCWRWVRPGPR